MKPDRWTRLSVDVSPSLNRAIEKLASRMNGSKAEVLRRAFTLLQLAVEAQDNGKKLGVAEKGQQLSTELVVL